MGRWTASRKVKEHVGTQSSGSTSVASPSTFTPSSSSCRQRVIPFYGDRIGNRFREFSNFYSDAPPFQFELPDFAQRKGWPTSVECGFSEKAIMLTKAALMGDRESFDEVAISPNPKSCKALGRGVRNFKQELWDIHLEEVAFEVVKQKFENNPELCAVLLSTGSAILAEAAPNDSIWGIGLNISDSRSLDPDQWRGRNVLGYALMKARDYLRSRRVKEHVGTQSSSSSVAFPSTFTPSSSSCRQRVIPFYSDRVGNRFREFSNFYSDAPPFQFELPDFAHQEGWPTSVECEFSERQSC